jgi:hypothetical protein
MTDASIRREFAPRRASAYPQRVGQAIGAPKTILRLEGGAVLAAASIAYAHVGIGWPTFALLFLVPDVSMLGYLINRKAGAALYNVGHSYLAPATLVGLGLGLDLPLALAIGLIWIAHIGFDRLLGYGLKYDSAFAHTHLGGASVEDL